MGGIAIKAPAKVNTILKIVGRRADGYHELKMVMVPLTLADEIEIEAAPSGIELFMDGQADSGMAAGKNLASRAAALMIEEAGVREGVRIHLTKRIPIAAGLGGGSSDAAAVLKALNELWHLGWDAEKLASIGARLGADVPFFCHGVPALVGGIGEAVTPLANFPNLAILLINPDSSVSTPWAYGQWDLYHPPGAVGAHSLVETEWLTPAGADARERPLFAAFGDVVASLHNDLEVVTASAHPEIARVKAALMGAGAAGALMSGSGPTVFGLFEDGLARDRALAKVEESGWLTFAAEADV